MNRREFLWLLDADEDSYYVAINRITSVRTDGNMMRVWFVPSCPEEVPYIDVPRDLNGDIPEQLNGFGDDV